MMTRLLFCLACVGLFFGGCADDGAGDVQLDVMIDALSAADVGSVKVTISGAGMSPMTANLTKVGTSWQGVIGQIPAGTNRTFVGEARDGNGTLVYNGTVSGVLIKANNTALVQLLLQETSPPPPFPTRPGIASTGVRRPASLPAATCSPRRV